MNELLEALKPYVSRNEYSNEVEVSSESFFKLEDIIDDYDWAYIDIIESRTDDAMLIEITLDLDEQSD